MKSIKVVDLPYDLFRDVVAAYRDPDTIKKVSDDLYVYGDLYNRDDLWAGSYSVKISGDLAVRVQSLFN